MNDGPDVTGTRKQPPVIRYALIIGAFVALAIVVGSIVGQRAQNPQPSPVSSPQ
jgi:hypothetical protein